MKKLALIAIGIIIISGYNKCIGDKAVYYTEYLAKDVETGENVLLSGPIGYHEKDSVWRTEDNVINETDSNTMRAIILHVY